MPNCFHHVSTACALALNLASLNSPASAQAFQTTTEIAGPGHLDRQQLNHQIEAILKKNDVYGAYVTITMGPDTVLSRTFGIDPSSGEQFAPTTKVRLASASKLLTALTIATLEQNGSLSLDETLGSLDPNAPQAWRNIPIWRILNHTSGLPMVVSRADFNALDKDQLLNISINDLRSMIGDQPLDFAPGDRWRYQQSGYAMLAHAVAERAGMSWNGMVDKAVIEAAGLENTGFGNDAAVFELRDEKVVPHIFTYPELFAPAGGFQTTGDDVRRLLLALAKGSILNEDSLRSFINDARRHEQLRRDVKGEGYGKGVTVQRFGNLSFFGHSGGGGLADIRYAPERQLGIAVLTNRAGGTGAAIEVADMIAEKFAGKAHNKNDRET